jgi:D-psicose/D-tagatose/L-ribulose 3-epimerase
MQLGVNAWVWISPLTTDGLAEVAAHVAEMGYDLLETAIEAPGGYDYARTGDVIKDHGLGVSLVAVIPPDGDLLDADEKVRENGRAYMRHCIDAAHALGAVNFGGPFYSALGRTWQSTAAERERDLDLLAGQLRELADYAADRGVVLCVEPINRFETSFINTAGQLLDLLEWVDHPACKATLDTFHMNIEEKSLGDAIRAVGPRLGHLHACENDRGAPGSGHVPWADVAGALRDINYDGPVVIESFSSHIEAIASAAAIWRPLAPTQDALARDGLAFMQETFL